MSVKTTRFKMHVSVKTTKPQIYLAVCRCIQFVHELVIMEKEKFYCMTASLKFSIHQISDLNGMGCTCAIMYL